ncbi:hypothetical protein JCM33374_g3059 [Metschnikowia sp. JCM 33374]|nr:hypothetical protein JCM33374_g3059 [Metschnikowia sp. JCM 33374]
MIKYYYWLVVAFLASVVIADPIGCPATAQTGTGFDVTFYHYPLISTKKVDPKYNVTTFDWFGYLGSTSGVTQVNFQKPDQGDATVAYDQVYNFGLTYSNFSMNMTGYFLAPQTGTYTFSFTGDDSISFSVGSSGSCCGSVSENVDGSSAVMSAGEATTFQVNLVAGLYYPTRLLYLNVRGGAQVDVSYTAPDGSQVTEVGPQIYQIAQPKVCYTSTTQYWTGTEISTTTAPGDITQTVIVELPYATTTSYYYDSITTTSTIVPVNGGQPTLVVQVPPATATTYWPGPFTTTTTWLPPDGSKPTVIVYLPPVTTTSYWPEQYTSTTTIVPPDGGQPTAIVNAPVPPTSTVTWTGTYTLTETTTGANGDATVLVGVPPAPTVTSPGTGEHLLQG